MTGCGYSTERQPARAPTGAIMADKKDPKSEQKKGKAQPAQPQTKQDTKKGPAEKG